MFKKLIVIFSLLIPTVAFAEDQKLTVAKGQAISPVGLVVNVKTITLGEDAVTVRLLASFNSNETMSINMNDGQNAYLSWGDNPQERLHLRQIADNQWMRIANGQSMEGDLVFPGVLPEGIKKLVLAFNPENEKDDTDAPQLVIPLELAE